MDRIVGIRPYLVYVQFFFLVVLVGVVKPSFSQVQPLSVHDSAVVVGHLENSEAQVNLGNAKEASRFLNETALIYWEHNQYKRAIYYYEKSFILNESIENENGLAMLNNNLGMLYSDVEEYEKSYDHFQKTLGARRSQKAKIGMISALINISVVLNNLNRYEESIEGLEEALELARETNDPVQMRSCYGMMSETFEKAGNIERSIYYFNLYRSFHEMIQKKEVDILKYGLKEEQIVSEYEREKNRLSQEALSEKQASLIQLKNEMDVYDLRIKEYDSIQLEHVNSLSEKELKLGLLESENELKNAIIKVNKTEHDAALERARLTNVISILIIVSVLIFCGFILVGLRNLKSYSKHIKKKHEELKLAQNQLIKSEKMASMGVLVSGLGHELNNPLNFIKNGALALSNLQNDIFKNSHQDETIEKSNQYFKIIDEGVVRSTKIIDSLSHICTPGDQMNEKCNLHDILDNCLAALGRTISDKVQVSKNYYETPLIIAGNEGKLHQAFIHIISNALNAMKDGGELSLFTKNSNKLAVVSVADTGIGIPEENIAKIGDPFFTTMPPGKGIGLGLYITNTIIKGHHGEIKIDSQLGRGSKFAIELPTGEN